MTRRRLSVVPVVLVLLVSGAASAQAPTDVDCSARLNTRVAQTVCASPELVALGQIIADGYTATLP